MLFETTFVCSVVVWSVVFIDTREVAKEDSLRKEIIDEAHNFERNGKKEFTFKR